ncbi:MAG: hypothetical protein CHACPFDD_03127 [Phycisphaerae bacterium]|nr:hypothetical protein [Phycisphaerae bacterium]
MAGPMQKVKRGDPLVIPAATFNTFIDAARDFQQRQRSARRDAVREQRDTGIVLVRNESGADRERFDVLGIEGPIIERVDNEDEFKQRVALRGVVPSSPHPGKFAILLEPAKDQAIVRACVDGVCVVRVRMVDEAHTSADIAVGVASRLDSGDSGTARLLWVEPVEDRQDPEIAWTVARIGGGGGGSVTAAFAMITSKSGTAPPFRYAAVQATMDADGAWTQVGGGAAYNNVFNIEEQGAGGQWVNPLVVGDVVLIFAAPDPGIDAFVCTRSHYRGTY